MVNRINLCLALLMLSLVLFSCSDGQNNQTTDAYDFPVKPGTEQWKSFSSHMEMIEACQIPDSVLHNMSTAGLVETVLNYPLLIDMSAYGSLQTGLDAVSSYFDGIPELLSREDAGTELLAKYSSIDIGAVSLNWEPLDRAIFKHAFDVIEILLVQEVILSKMNTSKRLDLLTEAMAKSDEKSKHEEIYGKPPYSGTIRIMVLVLEQEEYPPLIKMIEGEEALQRFLAEGVRIVPDFFDLSDEIISMAQEFLSQEQPQ